MRATVIWSALLVAPVVASAECRRHLTDAVEALARLEPGPAEASLRKAEEVCRNQESAGRLAGLLYDRALGATPEQRPPLLREAWKYIELAMSRGAVTAELLTVRAAIAGDLAQVSDSSSEQARLLLAVHADATRARSLEPQATMPLVVLGAWHRNAAGLSFSERMFVRMVAGSLPDASLEESRRLLEQAVSKESTPVTLFFLGATREEQGDGRGARSVFARCARTEARSLREMFVRDWCRDRVAPR